jgi:hypothetical protein
VVVEVLAAVIGTSGLSPLPSTSIAGGAGSANSITGSPVTYELVVEQWWSICNSLIFWWFRWRRWWSKRYQHHQAK